MRSRNWLIAHLIFFLFSVGNILYAQQGKTVIVSDSLEVRISKFGAEVRGKSAITAGVGSVVMNGDLADPQFDIYFSGGFKQFLGSYVNINITYHKFNLVYKDVFNEGFMSFDLNIETLISPYRTFTPFFYAGAGINAANYFEQSDLKVQGGVGIEVLVAKNIGLKLYADYNHVFSDEVEGVVFGDADDVYWRMAGGLNFYFGKPLENKLVSELPTVIDSNPIVDDY